MAEELGDLLLQVVFHGQLAKERGAFDFEKVCHVGRKMISRDPHVFGKTKVKNVDEVWANGKKSSARKNMGLIWNAIPHSMGFRTFARVAARGKTS